MIVQESKENSIRKEYFDHIRLSRANRELAETYLDMDQPEDPELLKKAEPQDLSSAARWIEAKADYLKWLLKKKKTEELKRLVRLLVEVGGSTAWNVLVSFSYFARPGELEKVLIYLEAPYAEAQKMALRAGLCAVSLVKGSPEDAKELCRLGNGHAEIFLDALNYCRDSDRVSGIEKNRNAYMLLQAMYLYYTEPGAAPEVVRDLEERMVISLADLMAFERRELACIQDFARTADRDTPFPHRILSIYSQRRSGANTAGPLSACAFLALRHSVRFEILLRLMAAIDHRYQGRNLMLATCMGVAEEEYFDACMEELEDMLPIPDENYIIWCMEYGYTRAVERMAVKCPDGIRDAAVKMDFKLYRELMEVLQRLNLELFREMKADYRKISCEKAASELVSRVSPGRADAREYLLGNGPVEILEPYVKEWGGDLYEERETYARLTILKRTEPAMYRRGIVLEALRRAACVSKSWQSTAV